MLADLLDHHGTPARELDAAAPCEIEGDRTNRPQCTFSDCCEQVLASCPISRALSPGVPITLDAHLTRPD